MIILMVRDITYAGGATIWLWGLSLEGSCILLLLPLLQPLLVLLLLLPRRKKQNDLEKNEDESP